jgi:hypothetical protein
MAQVTVRAFTVVPTRSGVLRALSEREILDLFSARLAAISLSGYIFFGSSVSISDQARLMFRFPITLPHICCVRVASTLCRVPYPARLLPISQATL